jgi:DNA-binding LacI/PurR family transcriptional regulator
MKRATMRDVAHKAGVSKSTVSHVINGTRFVEPETKQRVEQVIAELGYRPSIVARSLTTNRTKTIGIIVSDTSNHFFGELIRGIENILRSQDYSLLVCNTDETLELEEHYLNLLLAQQVDGIIAAATSQYWKALDYVEMKNLPLVFVDRAFEGMDTRHYVGVDNFAGAYLGTQHLINCGYQRIGALAGFQRLSSMRDRLAGFKQALQDHNIPLREEWIVESPLSPEGGKEAARHILSQPDRPEALLVSNNFLSLGTLLTLNDLGLNCPRDIGLVCFDDHPWAAVSDPPLTVIQQPVLDIGERAAQILLSLLNSEEVEESKHLLACELIVRKSCRKIP